MTNFEKILKGLVASEVKFVLVGGLAAVTHGSAYQTRDIDICYQRTKKNISRLVKFLKSTEAQLRGVNEEIPFILDEKTFQFGLNFTFKTKWGDLDLLGELAGLGSYEKVYSFSEPLDLYGLKIDVLSLDGLIQSKRAVGRPKDQLHLKELEAIKAMKRGS